MISRPISDRAALPARADRPILVAVRDACEEIVAGFGSALLHVRTLDGLSCEVRAGELLLLVGGVASGATSLLSALYGPPMSRARAQRVVSPSVQVRRATIAFSVSEAIIRGWRDTQHAWDAADSRADGAAVESARVVYLLRVRPDDAMRPATTGAISLHSWREWAGMLKRRGDAVVLARHANPERALTLNEKRATGRGALPESAMVRESRDREEHHVRVLTLHAGRIVSADRREV